MTCPTCEHIREVLTEQIEIYQIANDIMPKTSDNVDKHKANRIRIDELEYVLKLIEVKHE